MNDDSDQGTKSVFRADYVAIGICFLLSGFAGLLYETVWLRQFAIVLGTSEQALAVILASYMGGLAVGAWVASRTVARVRRPVLTYGLLEAGIAICALLMPWGLRLVSGMHVQIFGGTPVPPAAGSLPQTLFGLASSFGLILLPTAMMGATLPLLTKYVVHHDREVGPRIGILYGINTFGAVAGTLAAAFLFLPAFGLARTTWVGAAINLAIFVLVVLIARRQSHFAGTQDSSLVADSADGMQASESGGALELLESENSEATARYHLIVWFAAAFGAIAFCFEIIFTRMLGHILGGSIYSFATMLAGFLLGIALGGTIASRFAVHRDRSVILLVYTQCGAAISGFLAYQCIDLIADWSFTGWGGSSATLTQVVVSVLILMPTSTFIGATFPLATRIYARNENEAAAAAARVYFWNTVGGIGGALLTGMVLLGTFGYEGAISIAVSLGALLSMLLAWLLRAQLVHLLVGACTILILLSFRPAAPERLLRVSAFDSQPTPGDIIFHEVGKSGTVTLFDQQTEFRFMTNGLPEATVASRGNRISPFNSSGAWLAALPPLLRPDCKSMLIIGLGGGVAAAHVPPSVEEFDVFELEESVVNANRFVSDFRRRDPLDDARMTLILNDGRNGLALTSRKYDAVVSQPSHPWTAGASHLYTREFAETVSSHLNDGGIFLQWMNTDFVNPELFRSLAATLFDVFPHVRVYEPIPGNTLFVASGQPIRPEAIEATELEMDPRNVSFYASFGIRTPTQLLTLLRIDEPQLRQLSEGAAQITDEQNVLAMKAPALIGNPDRDGMEAFLRQHALHRQPAEQLRSVCPQINLVDLGARLADRDMKLDSKAEESIAANELEKKLYLALLNKKNGELETWAQLLREATATAPDDPRAPFLLTAQQALGLYQGLRAEEIPALRKQVTGRYGELLSAIDALVANDIPAILQREETLASFTTDEVGYEMAIRLRVLGRIADTQADPVGRGREAMALVSEAMPVIGVHAVIPFCVMAAMKCGDQETALVTTQAYAKSVVKQIKQKKISDVSQLQVMRSNLIKCYDLVRVPERMSEIPKSVYRPAVKYIERVIAGDID